MSDFTYAGPSVSAAFVAGIFNDAWDKARAQMAAKDAILEGLEDDFNDQIKDIERLADGKDDSDGTGAFISVQDDGGYTPELLGGPKAKDIDKEADKLRDRLQDQLKEMLHDFMLDFFPFYEIPDGSDAWARVVETFDNQKFEGAVQLIRQRVYGAWAERGIQMPFVALDSQRRSVDRVVDDTEVQSERAQELMLLRESKGLDLIRFEQVNRQQIEALEAARAFLLSTLLPMSRKVSEDQDRITAYKRALMNAYYGYVDTLADASETEAGRLIYERKRAVKLQMGINSRRLFKTNLMNAAIESELASLSRRASAALASLGGSARFDGSESSGA